MKVLNIDPEFRDKVPPLTDTELHTLEENIVKDGRVLVPIITWNDTIIDGHNRYSIVQRHPEIPFDVVEREFSDRYEAIVWICRNQLGRRNLTDERKTYLIGKQLEAQKLTVGNTTSQRDKDGHYTQLHQNDVDGKKRYGTAARIAEEHGLGEQTVVRAEKFAKGVDEVEAISPGAKDKLLSGKVNIPKFVVASIPQMEDAEKQSVIEMITEGQYKKPSGNPAGFNKEARANKAKIEAIVTDMYDPKTVPDFTLDFLIEDIQINAANYIQMLRNTLVDRSTLLTEENRPAVAEAIDKYVIAEIMKVKELVV